VLQPATLLRQRYRVDQRLAIGGTGAVYRATDTHSKRTVAIKHLTLDGSQARAAFEREAHLLSQLTHARLPSVVDYFSHAEGEFLVMTFVPGADLADQLARRGEPFPPTTVLTWADDLLDLLTYLHTRQPPVVHRDIKPRNLKLDAEGHVILLDFGLARGVADTQATLAGYTLQYAPLEQVRGETVEPRSDLYALGAALFELLTRRPLIDAPQRAAVLAAGQPDPLSVVESLSPIVGTNVAEAIGQALALHPTQRPATARAMQVALREARSGAVSPPVRVAQPGATGRIEPPTGTVTFLATELLDEAPPPSTLARHDTLLHRAVDVCGGYVARSTLAGLTAAFATAESALAAALAAQGSIGPGRVRMALLTGTAQYAGAEYVSAVLPRVARLLAAAHAGQVLLGRATRDLLTGQLPDGVGISELGRHRLPDLPEPEHVCQIVSPDLLAEFPPLISRELRGPASGRKHAVARPRRRAHHGGRAFAPAVGPRPHTDRPRRRRQNTPGCPSG